MNRVKYYVLVLFLMFPFDSEFIFDPVKWPRSQVDEDFQTIAQRYGALNSVVRVPSIDPKYKIALLLSKQVFTIPFWIFDTLCISCSKVCASIIYRIIVLSKCCINGRTGNSLWILPV